jgi:DNA-binding CsgD family transcriptional regulator
MFLTEKTVKFHLAHIYKKLSLKSRAQLIVFIMPYTFEKPTSEGVV